MRPVVMYKFIGRGRDDREILRAEVNVGVLF